MDFQPSLISGLGFSIVFGIIIMVIEIINPRYELKSYPQKIKDRVPPQTEEEKRKIKRGALILFPLIVAGLLVDYYLRLNLSHNLFYVFLHFFVVFMTWILFDLVIMDWLIFCTITPRFLVVPGSEGAREYKDYWFHLRGLFLGTPISIAVSAVLSLLVLIINTLFHIVPRFPGAG